MSRMRAALLTGLVVCVVACQRTPAYAPSLETTSAPPAPSESHLGDSLGQVLGSLKLVKEEYRDAVRDGQIIDAMEYAESEMFLQRARRKYERIAATVEAKNAAVHATVTKSLDGLDPLVARKGPVAEEEKLVDAAVAALEGLLDGDVPKEIRGVHAEVQAADAAIQAEIVHQGYRIGIGASEPRTQWLPGTATRIESAPRKSATHYVFVTIREQRTKRHLPRAEVAIGYKESPNASPLLETWGPFLHYGANFVMQPAKPLTLVVEVKAPAYNRHGDCLANHVEDTSVRFEARVEGGLLRIDGEPPTPVDSDWRIGDDVLQARAEARQLLDVAPYTAGYIAEAPEPVWRWKDGKLVPVPLTKEHTNHLEVVLLDRASGRMVTGADVTLELRPVSAPGTTAGEPLRYPLLPLMSVFNHYGSTVTVPPGQYQVTAYIERPTFATLDATLFDARTVVHFTERWTRQASAQ